MEVNYGQPDIKNLIYSDLLRLRPAIKVNKKQNERKYNDDIKLLLAEMLFINRYVEIEEKEARIIYIGAAPGFHLAKLMKCYPFIKFDLYDDQDLHPDLEKYISENNEQVTMFRELFTLETCDKYSNSEENIYVITDHKEPQYGKDPFFGIDTESRNRWQNEKEESYRNDMEFQKEVCLKLQPKCAYLRFRPPHFYEGEDGNDATFEYFKGVAWLMIYNDYKSTESRLAVEDFSKVDFKWNYQNYQYRLNYFNDSIRESLLLNPLTGQTTPLPNQLGNKFETVMMFTIMIEYMNSIGITDIRIGSLMDFYEKFMVLEFCSDVPGMYSSCDLDTVHSATANDDESCEYIDPSLQLTE